jgi:hypothetical protein
MLVTILVVLLLIDLFVFMALDRYILSLVLLVVSAVGLYFLAPGVSEAFAGVTWQSVVLYSLGYLAVGTAVAVGKWILFLFGVGRYISNQREKFESTPSKDLKSGDGSDRYGNFLWFLTKDSDFHRKFKLDDTCDAPIKDWRYNDRTATTSKDDMLKLVTPVAKNYATRISMWVCQWPFVIIGLLFEDILVRFGQFVTDVIGVLFGKLGRLIIGRSVAGM